MAKNKFVENWKIWLWISFVRYVNWDAVQVNTLIVGCD